MKKLLIVFFILVSVFSFAAAYHQTQQSSVDQMIHAGEKGTRSFWIPNSQLFSSPHSWKKVYPLLQEAANEANVNLIRTSLGYNEKDTPEVIQYVLLTGNTQFFKNFSLQDGRFLTPQDMKTGQVLLSTKDTGKSQQIGVLKAFGGSPIVEIRPLQQANEYLPAAGKYSVEASSQQAYQSFAKHFVTKINAHFKQEILRPYQSQSFLQGNDNRSAPPGFGTLGGGLFNYVQEILYLIVAITLLLLVYYSFHAAKRIGIMKMQGVSNFRIWYLIVGRFIILSFFISSVACLIAAFIIPDTNGLFIVNIMRIQGEIYAAILVSSLLAYLYIVTIRISDAIKNRKHTKSIFVVNTLMKAGWTVFLVLVILGIWNQYEKLNSQQALLQDWQQTPKTEDYGVFYPVSVGHAMMGIIHGTTNTQYVETQWLYPYLNQRGALFIDTRQYEESTLLLPHPSKFIRSIKVNPNYLKQFPIYNADGEQVKVPESTSDWVLLVPKKYQSKKKQILQYFHKERLYIRKETRQERFSVPKQVQKQSVEIIWTENNQRIFSFNPKVFPNEYNVIIDPIIQVLTENNTIFLDGLGFISGDEASSLKVRLIQNNPELTMKKLQPKLKDLRLDDRLRDLVGINQAIAEKIQSLQRQMDVFLIVGLGLLVSALFLAAQNLVIFFTRYQRKFLVRRLFGFSFARTYKEYLWFLVITWIGQLLISLFVANGITSVGPPGTSSGMTIVKVLIIVGVLILIELATTGVALIRIGRRNMAKALKEGT